MEKWGRILRRLLYPGGILKFIITMLAAGLLICCFANENQDSLLSYAAYMLSAYALIVLIVGFPNMMRHLQKIKQKIEALLSKNKYGDRYINDTEFRVRGSLYQGLSINLLFAAFKLTTGFIYGIHLVWSSGYILYNFERDTVYAPAKRTENLIAGK